MKPAPQRSRHLSPGDKLGKYDLIRQIAIGGMAELYLSRTVGIEGFEKLVVLKRILPQYASNASFVNMFLNEARLAATLHHTNIAQVYDIGVEDGDYFFAMEYVHGEDLDRMSTQAQEQGVPMSMDAALTLVSGLCAGLHYAHEKLGPDGRPQQIVHRDVSPSNVLVSYDGSVKLVDFGIARAFGGKTNTTQGGLKGKIVFMSPEQCRSDAVLDRRSDIYSVGTLLYELTVGRTPFTGETEYAILNQIVNVDVPAPSTFVPGYPPELERIVLRALARDPAERYATALLLQGDIEDFAHDNRLRVSPLVLARLMDTLFPAKLEEWDHAKAQGAFFVEQTVVKTLIEAGKTPDPNDPQQRAQVKELRQALEADDPTAISQPLVDGDTTIGPPPVEAQTAPVRMPTPVPPARAPTPQPAIGRVPTPQPAIGRVPTPQPAIGRVPTPQPAIGRVPTPQPDDANVPEPVPAPEPPSLRPPTPVPPSRPTPMPSHARAVSPHPHRAASPVPGMPGAVPILPGTLVSHPTPVPALDPSLGAVVAPVPSSQVDVTERVRLPRAPSPTNFVRAGKRRRGPVIGLVALLVAGGGAAAIIAYQSSSGTVPPVTSPAPPAPQVVDPAPAPATDEAAPALPDPPTAANVEPPGKLPAPAKVETAAKLDAPKDSDPKPHKIARPTPKPHSKPKSDARSKPEPKSEEKPWNADSVFMPVRTDKH